MLFVVAVNASGIVGTGEGKVVVVVAVVVSLAAVVRIVVEAYRHLREYCFLCCLACSVYLVKVKVVTNRDYNEA